MRGPKKFVATDEAAAAEWTGEERLCLSVIQQAIQDLRQGAPSPEETKRLEDEACGLNGRSAQRFARSRVGPMHARRAAFQSAHAFLFTQPSNLDFMAAGLGLDADLIRDLARPIADTWSACTRPE